MISSVLRLNAEEAELLLATLHRPEDSGYREVIYERLRSKLKNAVRLGQPVAPYKQHSSQRGWNPRRKPLNSQHNIELLTKRSADPAFRQPKCHPL